MLFVRILVTLERVSPVREPKYPKFRHQMKLLRYIIICLSIAVGVYAPAHSQSGNRSGAEDEKNPELEQALDKLANDPYDLKTAKKAASIYIRSYNHRGVIELMLPFFGHGMKTGDPEHIIYPASMLGQSYMELNIPDSMRYYLNVAQDYAEAENNGRYLAGIYCTLGLYAVDHEGDYPKAINYFLEGLRIAENLPDPGMYYVITANLAITYYYMGDPDGMEYAEKTYARGHEIEDKYLTYSGSIAMASFNYMFGNHDLALKYIIEAEALLDSFYDATGIYMLHANILAAKGNGKEAEDYFRKALEHSEGAAAKSLVNMYVSYGGFMTERGRYGEAIALFERGIDEARRRNIIPYRYKLYESMSATYKEMGDTKNALKYYEIFHMQSDSVFNIEKERSINELKIQYETEKAEKEIQEHKLVILREEKKFQITLLICLIVIVIFVAVLVYYRRKNAMYRQLVKQRHEFMQKTGQILTLTPPRSHVNEPDADLSDLSQGAKYSDSPLSDERGQELFSRMERLMNEDHIYRNKDLTVEKLAEILNTNRSYISRTVNEFTGMTFNNYINSLRIDEAVKVLSDINDDIPLKALSDDLGFNTRSTFYRSFQKLIGVPPSKYREEIRKMYSDN